MSAAPLPLLAEIVRSGFVEGHHRGSVVVLGADGGVEFALGLPDSPVYPRSSNKPFQAAGVLASGLALSGERLALATASHSGEPFHLDLVRTMLAEHGLSESDLRCPAALPIDPEETEAYLASGQKPSRTAMNCSGKHTAMLAASAANGWPLDTYTDPDHPLQRLIRGTLEEAAGESVAHTGVDGCGAPVMALTLTGLARGFRTLALASSETPEGRVADAMRAHPEYVAGTRRHDTWLMRGLPGAVSKEGAEAVQGVGLPDGRALAIKLDDGGKRALGPVLAQVLGRVMGVAAPVLDQLAEAPVLGGGEPVGRIRAAF
ncbi:asparaginase [Streptomyces iconiensis]|uniref:Asparaginase n=1 Tax=Streptomyces iconiensis TaxID=1384038 RepID=A0ABT7A500_9ACTN|nr:asparaginase [Streptomyces iconiensis]MDJ1135881.1 asparaginase [Streptomyces iconiensis]